MQRLPVTLVGGYLGAGKTTLVNHLLRNAAGRRIAVAVNEFGALPVDRDLIESADGDVLTLAGGCICCSFGDDLSAGLALLTSRAEKIDHVIVEASGVALPASIARTLSLLPGFSHDATLVVIDAETAQAQAADRYIGDTVLRQLAEADLVVVNKTDLVSDAARRKLHAWLATTAPRAEKIETSFGALAPDIALGARNASLFACDEPTPHETAALSTETFLFDHPVDAARLAHDLAAETLGLVRAKGFVHDAQGVWRTVQIVGRRAVVAAAPAGYTGPGGIACIAHGRAVERDAVERLIGAASA